MFALGYSPFALGYGSLCSRLVTVTTVVFVGHAFDQLTSVDISNDPASDEHSQDRVVFGLVEGESSAGNSSVRWTHLLPPISSC